ncbi:hypothetical protein [Enterovibrio calviensis]|uniref:hypothetical protein n=1 Tax=Enterovibrio calviensis TaxID=91359 RepID=UPI0006887E3B|nr:hypothetical protein [Enterovibrio calviensis]
MRNNNSTDSYHKTAHSSESIHLQKNQSSKGFLRKMITKGQKFSFTKANGVISTKAIKDLTPSKMAEPEDKGKEIYWDDERLLDQTLSPFAHFYFFFVGLAKACLIIIFPLVYIIMLFGLTFGEGGWHSWEPLFIGFSLYFVLPALMIWGHFKLFCAGYFFLAPFLKARLLFQLNRKTGMVTLYKGKDEIHFTHPFVEFDCVLMSAPSPQGQLNYSLVLIHRYNDYSVGVPIGNLLGPNEMVAEYHRLWNMIQRYMDVSQPMPDIMVLEPSRERDPTTATYDKKHARNPRYWRDMTDEEFEMTIDKIRQEQNYQPSSGPEIDIFESERPL